MHFRKKHLKQQLYGLEGAIRQIIEINLREHCNFKFASIGMFHIGHRKVSRKVFKIYFNINFLEGDI